MATLPHLLDTAFMEANGHCANIQKDARNNAPKLPSLNTVSLVPGKQANNTLYTLLHLSINAIRDATTRVATQSL
jgi:hypothetical protein